MNVYTTDKIRNVVLLGHGGSGKTTIVEAMAYLSGITNRMGTVTDGNTISDYDKEEIKRGFSISTSVVPIEWRETKINLLDTPGFFDFVGEVEEAAAAADAAIIVVNGKAGVEVGTQKAWDICEKYNLPRMIWVTNMDDDNASFRQVVVDLQELYGKKIAPLHLPIRENGQFVGYVNVIQMKAKRWKEDGTVDKTDVPDYSFENLEICREALLESVAETSEEYMDRYFSGDTFSENEIRQVLHTNVCDGSMVPISMASGTMAKGIYTLLDDIVKYLPSPEKKQCKAINIKTNEVYDADFNFAKAKSAYVFKTMVDPFIGKYSFVKVCSGVFRRNTNYLHVGLGKTLKFSTPTAFMASKKSIIDEAYPGDIVGLHDTGNFKIGDTLTEGEKLHFKGIPSFSPELFKYIENADPMKSKQLAKGVDQLMDEGVA